MARKTLDELEALDAGSWFDPRFAGETIPTLAKVLAWAGEQEPHLPLMIELKGSSKALGRGLVEKCVQLVIEHEMSDDVIFISSYYPFLSRVKSIAPGIASGTIVKLRWFDRLLPRLLRRLPSLGQVRLLRWRLLRPLTVSLALGADSLSIPATALTPTLIGAAHVAGLAISPGGMRWDYAAVIALGVDTISADDPAAVRAAYLTPSS